MVCDQRMSLRDQNRLTIGYRGPRPPVPRHISAPLLYQGCSRCSPWYVWCNSLHLRVVRLTSGLAGDTAQCISNDSSFRFAEIKDLFYKRYASISKTINEEDFAKPTQFALVRNYRSHQGILNLASMVMKLLWNGKYQLLWFVRKLFNNARL